MTINNFLPGINNVVIKNGWQDEYNSKIELKSNEITSIGLSFTLTGLNKIIDPIFGNKKPFYIYIFLEYQNGGMNYEVISSARFYCDDDILQNEELDFATKLEIPSDWNKSAGDFVAHCYYLHVAYSEFEAEDGSDLNSILYSPANKLFLTKLNIY